VNSAPTTLLRRRASLAGKLAPTDAPVTREQQDRPSFYLHPGRIHASAEPVAVTTILGSCVAVCLWDPTTKIGGINHFVLPQHVSNGESSPRFGNIAMEWLVEQLTSRGCRVRNLTAKVFGGASVLSNMARNIGQDNVTLALAHLAELGITVVAQDVGGKRGRKLVFHTDDGNAWVQEL